MIIVIVFVTAAENGDIKITQKFFLIIVNIIIHIIIIIVIIILIITIVITNITVINIVICIMTILIPNCNSDLTDIRLGLTLI